KETDYKGSFPEFRSKICVPIRTGGEVIGVMNFNHEEPNAFDNNLVRIAEVFACQTAVAVNNERLSRREERTRQSLELSRAINEEINATLDQDKILSTLVNKLGEINKVTAADVFIYNPEKQLLTNNYRLKQGGEGSVKLELGQGLAGKAARSHKTINVGDVRKDRRYRKIRKSTRSELTVPMIQDGKLRGVINLESDQLEAFDEHDEGMLETVAPAACIAIRNAREYEKLKQTQGELESTNRQMTAMEDDARFALSRYLHDDVQKTIGRLKREARQQGIPEIFELTHKLEQQEARMRFELTSPILDLRLELMQLIKETLPRFYPESSCIRHTVRLTAFDDIEELDRPIKVLVYRFVQGAVTNVYRHAKADHVRIEAECQGDELLVRVVDNGLGFDISDKDLFIEEGHYFFYEIENRAKQLGGSFNVNPERGKGATLELSIPFAQPCA
ncbi:GAF domain-containing protein, partial [Chloroflexota bacterium]